MSLHAEVLSQQAKVSIEMNEVSLSQVFQELSKQSKIDFFYNYQLLTKKGKVDVKVEDKSLKQFLEEFLPSFDLDYSYIDQVIIIRERSPQQQKEYRVVGKVLDSNKNPLPGVTIRLEGTTVGTSTNNRGEFVLELPLEKGKLIFSFIGFRQKIVPFEAVNFLEVVLEEEVSELNEVVITGYQTVDVRRNTAAIQSLKMDDIKVPGVQTIDQLLEGRVPGMIFMQNSGQVGAAPKLRVRGTSTVLGNQEPVWVLDGIVLRDPVDISPSLINNLDFVNLVGNAISGINPDDIERIDILKDAAATALYGAKAANGVINITTKRGKEGPPSLTYNMNGKFTARPRYSDRSIHLMNSKERIAFSREIVEKGLQYPSINNLVGYEGALYKYYDGTHSIQQFLHEVERLETVNTDWFKLLTEDAFSNSHTLSLSGGSSNIRYYGSLGFSDEKGVIKMEKNQRYSASMNINGAFNRFSFMFSMLANKGLRKYANPELNILDYAYNSSRAIPAYQEDGSLYFYKKRGNVSVNDAGLGFNALHEMKHFRDEYNNSGITFQTNLNYRFRDDLKGQFIFSYGINNTTQETFIDEDTFYAASLRGTDFGEEMPLALRDRTLLPVGGEYRENNIRNENYTLRFQLDFVKYLDKNNNHLINSAIGMEVSSTLYKGKEQTHRGYLPMRGKTISSVEYTAYPTFTSWKMTSPEALGKIRDNVQNEVSGYFTVSYTLNNTYTFNFNTRADASNKFGDRSREKILPVWSVSANWDMKANVFKQTDWINHFLLRSSYGYQGNMLSNQTPELIIKKGGKNNYFEEYESSIAHYPNPHLKWEKTGTVNASLDFSFFNDRLRGTFSYFYKKTKDAFLSKTVADINGIENYVINSGTVENKGFEVSFNFTPVKSSGRAGAFRWDIDPQFGQVINRLLTYAINNKNFDQFDTNEIYYTNYLDGTALIKGKPLNAFYSYKFKGLSPEDGRPEFFDIEEDLKEEYLALGREEVYKRVMKYSGTRVPVLQGGISNTLSYRRLSVNFNIAYSFGSKIRLLPLYEANRNGTTIAPLPERNVRKEFVHRWQHPGDERFTNIPGLLPNREYNSTQTSPWWIQYGYTDITFSRDIWQMYDNSDLRTVSGDYVKLQSFVLNYSLPEKLCKRIKLKSAHIGLSGHNLFTICNSKLKGQDPSQSGTSDRLNLSLRPSCSMNISLMF